MLKPYYGHFQVYLVYLVAQQTFGDCWYLLLPVTQPAVTKQSRMMYVL